MAKLDRTTLDNFQSALAEVDDSWQTEFNLREVVRDSFFLIKRVRDYKVSWEKIADVLKQSSDGNLSISPVTIRQYFFEISRNPEEQPKSKRKSKSKKTVKKNSNKSDELNKTNQKTISDKIPEKAPTKTDIKPLQKSQIKLADTSQNKQKITLNDDLDSDIKSQFNL